VRGIELCTGCLTPRREDPPPIVAISPGRVILARLRIMAALWATGLVAGALVGRFIVVPSVLSAFPGRILAPASFTLGTTFALGVAGALLVQGFGGLFLMARIQFAGSVAWKRTFLEALRIPAEHEAQFRVVLARTVGSNLLAPEQGVLAYTEGGVVFLGKRGTRLAIPATTIVSVRIPRWSGSWPVRPLRVALASGETWNFAFQEGKTLRAASALADAAGAKLGRP
jgi:hypothetical protein